MTIEVGKILDNQEKAGKPAKIKSFGDSEFGSVLMDVIGGAEQASATAVGMYGGVNSSAVLTAAFSGVNAYSAASGGGGYGGTPYMSSGFGGYNSHTASVDMTGLMGADPTNDGSMPVIEGTTGYSQMDMINQMNANSLQLLSLQAKLQIGMQDANTKSNILSADHKAKMAIIEKFAARG